MPYLKQLPLSKGFNTIENKIINVRSYAVNERYVYSLTITKRLQFPSFLFMFKRNFYKYKSNEYRR